jgi:tRNA G18 (ribose-2'-O)-methylase SpoU
VALESIANPDNVGGIFRNAAAFGADGVLLDPATGDPLYRKAIRTSMGAVLRVPFARADWQTALPIVRSLGFAVVALTPDERAEPIDQFAARDRPERLALLVGNEGAGLSGVIGRLPRTDSDEARSGLAQRRRGRRDRLVAIDAFS